MSDSEAVGNASARQLGSRIRLFRRRRGFDLGHLARAAGISRTTLHHLEDGTTQHPRTSTLARIAAVLDVSLEELVESGLPESVHFDQRTNPVVSEVAGRYPELFHGWDDDDWAELLSTFGTGGALNSSGVLAQAGHLNRKRQTLQQLHIVLETHLAETAMHVIDALFQQVQVAPQREATPGPLIEP